jgi:hypothetical protein
LTQEQQQQFKEMQKEARTGQTAGEKALRAAGVMNTDKFETLEIPPWTPTDRSSSVCGRSADVS